MLEEAKIYSCDKWKRLYFLVMSLNHNFFGDVFKWLFFASVMYLEENKFGDCPSIRKLTK